MGRYAPGEVVRVSASFRVAGVLTDPGAVTLAVEKGDGTELALDAGSTPPVVKDSVGNYHADLDANVVGVWSYRFVGTSPAIGVAEGQFSVRTILGT